jgi:hypothetical protein
MRSSRLDLPRRVLATAQEMPPQQLGWQMHRHGVALVRRKTDETGGPVGSRSHGVFQRQATAGGGAFDENNVVAGLGQMPQSGQLAHV